MSNERSVIPIEKIERTILFIRGHKVMLDADLAELYGVSTKILNQAVKRNIERFPDKFMFQLTKQFSTCVCSYFRACLLARFQSYALFSPTAGI